MFDHLDKYIFDFSKAFNFSDISSLCQVRLPKEIPHLFRHCGHKTATQFLDLAKSSLN